MSPLWWTRDIWIGDQGSDVRAVQQLVGLPTTGFYDLDTASTVRGLQKMAGLPLTGRVDEQTAIALGPRGQDAILPDWWDGADIVPNDVRYDFLTRLFDGEDGIRRMQGNYGMNPTGVIDHDTALIMGALGEAR